jgi:hypothetical protein
LKKRSKKLLFPRSGRRCAPNKQKFFGPRRAGAAFFQKRTAFFLQPIALVVHSACSDGAKVAGCKTAHPTAEPVNQYHHEWRQPGDKIARQNKG